MRYLRIELSKCLTFKTNDQQGRFTDYNKQILAFTKRNENEGWVILKLLNICNNLSVHTKSFPFSKQLVCWMFETLSSISGNLGN